MREASRRQAGLSGLAVLPDGGGPAELQRGAAGIFGGKANTLVEDYVEAARGDVVGMTTGAHGGEGGANSGSAPPS